MTRDWTAIAIAAVTIVGIDDARAASVWSSTCQGDADVKMTYNPGDQVCASGDVDVVPPGDICGGGDLYVVPRDHPNPFADVTLGGANFFTTCLGAGAYIDQSVWLPPLKPGRYEIVLDQYPFFMPDGAAFDPGVDVRGAYFTVSNAPIQFSCNPAMIKAAALQAAQEAALIQKMVELIEAIQLLQEIVEAETPGALAYVLFCEALDAAESPIGCPEMPWDWTQGKALELLSNLGKALEHMYLDIAADPPDPNFLEVVSLAMTDPLLAKRPWRAPRGDEFSTRIAATAQLLAMQQAAYRAFLPSFEKLQGAQEASDHVGLAIQSEKMIAYLDLAAAAGEELTAQIYALEASMAGSPEMMTMYDGAAWQQRIGDAVTNGLSDRDKNFMKSFGLDDAQITLATELLAAYAVRAPLPAQIGYKPLFDRIREQHAKMAGAVADLRAQAEAVRSENDQYAFRRAPQLTVAQPEPGRVGTAQMLSASATHFDGSTTLTYAWDTDLDGAFDDATGDSIQYTPTATRQLVPVKVTDSAGLFDVGFARVEATATNMPPVIDALTPPDAAPFAKRGDQITFNVAASDPDGDALTITWYVDGTEAGTGADFAFTMPDEDAHDVIAIVADTDPYTADAEAGVVVRADRWEDGIDTDDAAGDPAGCGCATRGGGGAAAQLALLLVAAFWLGARRP